MATPSSVNSTKSAAAKRRRLSSTARAALLMALIVGLATGAVVLTQWRYDLNFDVALVVTAAGALLGGIIGTALGLITSTLARATGQEED